MKRFLNILLVLICVSVFAFAMASCTSSKCASHTDMDSNGMCDVCGTAYACSGHADVNVDGMCDFCLAPFACTFHYDQDGNEKCDQCGAPYTCPGHSDIDDDGICDTCSAFYTCPGHCDVDRNGFCDECQIEYVCPGHEDANADSHCDVCKTPWSCNTHKDNDDDGNCDYCKAPFDCPAHEDVLGNGRCDKCDRPYTCSGHKDENGDDTCDECKAYYKAPVDFRSEFAAAASATNPSELLITVTTSEVGMPSLTSTYRVTYAQNGSFVLRISQQKYNEDLTSNDIVVTLPTVTITCDENGNYSDGGQFTGSNPQATGIKVDFSKLTNYSTPSSTALNATVAAADTADVFGSAYSADVTLTVNKNESAITYVSLAYANVQITCAYN